MNKFTFDQYQTLDFGIGLTFVQKVIHRHNGEVRVRNLQYHSLEDQQPRVKVAVEVRLPFK